MAELNLGHISPDLLPTARYAAAALAALAREEALGRKPRRLLEPDHATWRRFRGRLGPLDYFELLLEDAAVTQPFAFDEASILEPGAARVRRLPAARVTEWLARLPELDLTQDGGDYVADQARRLELPTRLARSDLHTGVRAHHRVLELPGTGGQLSHYLAVRVDGIYLQDGFTIAWSGWRDRLLAGLVAVEMGLKGSAPILAQPGLDPVRAKGGRYDYVVGAEVGRGGEAADRAALAALFPGATLLLV